MRELDECTESDERVDAFCPIRGVGPYAVRPAIAEIGDITRFDLPACISPRREGTQAVRPCWADPNRQGLR
jgi:hypothetical protein